MAARWTTASAPATRVVERGVVGGQVGDDEAIGPRLVGGDAVDARARRARPPARPAISTRPMRPAAPVTRTSTGQSSAIVAAMPPGGVDVLVDEVEHDRRAAGFDSFIMPTAWPTK